MYGLHSSFCAGVVAVSLLFAASVARGNTNDMWQSLITLESIEQKNFFTVWRAMEERSRSDDLHRRGIRVVGTGLEDERVWQMPCPTGSMALADVLLNCEREILSEKCVLIKDTALWGRVGNRGMLVTVYGTVKDVRSQTPLALYSVVDDRGAFLRQFRRFEDGQFVCSFYVDIPILTVSTNTCILDSALWDTVVPFTVQAPGYNPKRCKIEAFGSNIRNCIDVEMEPQVGSDAMKSGVNRVRSGDKTLPEAGTE